MARADFICEHTKDFLWIWFYLEFFSPIMLSFFLMSVLVSVLTGYVAVHWPRNYCNCAYAVPACYRQQLQCNAQTVIVARLCFLWFGVSSFMVRQREKESTFTGLLWGTFLEMCLSNQNSCNFAVFSVINKYQVYKLRPYRCKKMQRSIPFLRLYLRPRDYRCGWTTVSKPITPPPPQSMRLLYSC